MLATYLPAFFVSGALCVIAAVLALVIFRPGRGGNRRAEPRAGEGLSRSPDERVSVTSGSGELRADGVTPPKP